MLIDVFDTFLLCALNQQLLFWSSRSTVAIPWRRCSCLIVSDRDSTDHIWDTWWCQWPGRSLCWRNNKHLAHQMIAKLMSTCTGVLLSNTWKHKLMKQFVCLLTNHYCYRWKCCIFNVDYWNYVSIPAVDWQMFWSSYDEIIWTSGPIFISRTQENSVTFTETHVCVLWGLR